MPQLNETQFGYRQEPMLFPSDDKGTSEFRRAMIEAGNADTITAKPAKNTVKHRKGDPHDGGY